MSVAPRGVAEKWWRHDPPHVEDHRVEAAFFFHGLVNKDAGREAGRGGRPVNLYLKTWIIWWRGNLCERTRESVHESGVFAEGRARAILLPWALVKHGKGRGWGER